MSTKIYAVAVERGRPHAVVLAAVPQPRYVLADKGYDTNAVVEQVEQWGGRGGDSQQEKRLTCRLLDRVRNRQRNRVEHFFGHLKAFRRLATRYEKTAASFLGFVHFFAALCWR